MKFKRIISTAAAVVMLGTCAPSLLTAHAQGAAPVIKVTFDDGGDAYTLHNGTLVQGRNGNALSLNGSEQYADINGCAKKLSEINGDYTISVWCNPAAIATWSRIYDLGNDTDNYVFLTTSNGSLPRYAVKKNGTELSFDSDTGLDIGSWHNVTVTKENSACTFYVDGFVTGTSTGVTTNLSELGEMKNLYLGKSQWPDPYYSGLIDDFEVYNSALSQSEVQTLAAEAYTSKRNEQIYANNCFVVNSHFYSDGTEIFAYDGDTAQTNGRAVYGDINIGDDKTTFTLKNAKDKTGISAYVASYEDGILKSIALKDIVPASDNEEISVTYDSNAYEKKLFVWQNMTPLKVSDGETAPDGGTITAVASIENDTPDTGSVSASLAAIKADGTETVLKASDTLSLNSLENKDITLSVSAADIPDDAKKLIIKVDTGEGDKYTAATLYCGIAGPVAAPADSDSTTNGAHDPSIVQFPGDDTYYVYSSHHLIFTSEDLINWKKYDFTNIDANSDKIAPNTSSFISNNYKDTMNGTYWAPDVIYAPEKDAAHPYWMYMSLSCGLGGRNSAISLVKSSSPLFWADSSADITKDEIVFATKESNSYITNAIDAHIYKDSTDGKTYFLYGSFWGGIQALPLTDDGKVEGVDYSSDAAILSSCAAVAKQGTTSIFTQKRGVAGPEGAWMYEYNEYRYCYTSFGWLGSNYNTRVARSPLTKSLSEDISRQLLDANGVVVGQEYDRSSGAVKDSEITGYKLIGSYRLGDGSVTMAEDGGNNWYYPRSTDDAHIYYGSGHNSVITSPDGESFYCSHFRKDAVEGAAVLQIRKLLYTPDGWPVVAAVSYAGETEQALPEEMIYGTYDLASVGRTKLSGTDTTINEDWNNHSGNRNYDLPVISSKVSLNSDKTVTNGSGNSIGTWAYDGDHTVTISFTADGDVAKDEFYKNGDTMTLLALYGYDKDEREPVIGLSGKDSNNYTQLAKKSMPLTYKTPAKTAEATDPVEIEKSKGGNPALGFDANGNILYAGDPAATVIGDTVYLICGHDTAQDEAYNMPEWVLYTSKDMKNWEYKGAVMNATDISWRNDNTSAWASQMVEYKGKYYLYFCTWDKTSSGKQSIGVAVADKPEGPYKDALDSPLVAGTFTEPESSGWNDIDPTVLIDTDASGAEHRYLAWGNGKYYVCELNEDMTSVKDLDGDGKIIMNVDVKERSVKGMNGGVFTEAPWLYKHDGKYYLFYAMNWREEMAYAMADNPLGRYDFKQIIMPPTATSNTNHPSVIDFNGKTYFIYHNGMLPHGSGFRRSVCIDELKFDENGYVYPVTETSIGLSGTASTIRTAAGKYVAHTAFTNSLSDASYPINAAMTATSGEDGYNTAWEITEPKYVPNGEDAKYYVSIQSVNKPGLYIKSNGTGVTLTQDANADDAATKKAMTFKTLKGLDGGDGTVSFQSVSDTDKYLTILDASTTLSYGTTAEDCSFTVGGATQKDAQTIDIADIEPEPDPEPDITQDFNVNTGTLISLTNSATPYTGLAGVTLYMGTRDNDFQPSQNFAIQAGGVSGNALVMNAGKYNSANRGPRMQIHTPVIPDGYTVTAQMQVKLGTAASVLRYNDSTSTETGTDITGLSTDWTTVKITITNDNDVFTRKMYVGDTEIHSDYTSVFPVFWGTTANNSGQSVYFDDLTIKTTDASGQTPPPATLPNPTSKFEFENNLTDSVTGEAGTTIGWDGSLENGKRITTPKSDTAVYADGYNGKAVSFTGNGSDGIDLGKIITNGNYTVSFRFKANAFTQHTAGMFVDVDGGTRWVSAPIGYQSDGTLMVWSNDSNYINLISSFKAQTGTWYQVTIAARGGTASMYVNGTLVGSGAIANVIDANTRTLLGVNYWDTPFNGYIDDVYVYNGTTLSAAQAKLLYDSTVKE